MKRILARVAAARAVRTVLYSVVVAGRLFKRGFAWLFVALAGRWQWQPPSWISWSAAHSKRAWRYVVARPLRAGLMLVTVLSAAGAVAWYATRPKPHYVTCHHRAAAVSAVSCGRAIGSLRALVV